MDTGWKSCRPGNDGFIARLKMSAKQTHIPQQERRGVLEYKMYKNGEGQKI